MTLEFSDHLRLIDERSTAFRAAARSASDLDLPVPSCPDWTLLDLVRHLGGVQRAWSAIVAVGPADARPVGTTAEFAEGAPRELDALLEWSAESTRLLLDALREVGPERGCWTWWGDSQSPQTVGAVARHQVQEATVHTYDAQLAGGAPEPLPEEPALDGVDEFLTTCCATDSPWPHEDATVDYRATEGGAWRLTLTAQGCRVTPAPAAGEPGDKADVSAWASAGELVLMLYGRLEIDEVAADGDRHVIEQLRDWEP
ncbi:maleylpyruvate isomerase N-terminal domain-containing protein [Kitasatospora sp. NPDC049285]|uniref:maleylpyruvate isomerase N-terminal domain-containing protein n=1 Tax=Kitasatospora sp. NPDC049285 TaxID=3157096 RepID=UPI003438A44D